MEKIEKLKHENLLIFTMLGLSFLTYFGFFVFCVVHVYYKFVVGQSEIEEPIFKNYQFAELDITTDETTYGWVSVPTNIDEYDSVSYRLESGNHILISNFGEPEYKCTGSCYCEDKDTGRRTALTLQKGVIFLVSAISTVTAINKAKIHFEYECREGHKGLCDVDMISSEVGDCDVLLENEIEALKRIQEREEALELEAGEEFIEYEKEDVDMTGMEEDYDGPDRHVRFECYGHCLINRAKRTQSLKAAKICSKMRFTGSVEFECKVKPRVCVRVARNIFMEGDLDRLCRHQSTPEFQPDEESKEEMKRWGERKLCVGTRHDGTVNHSINCREINPDESLYDTYL